MKNFSIILCIAIFTLVQVSCKKDFLDKTDPTKINTDLFYKDAKEVQQAVDGVYGTLQSIANNQWLFNELPSDNTTIDFNPGDRGQAPSIEAFEFYNWNSGTGNINSMYISHYNAIYNANNTLAKMQGAALSDSLKAVYEGQLKFIRAYLYFELTQYFGDVILITEPLQQPSDAYAYVRKPQDTVYAQIETDLKEAAAELPVTYPSTDVGRVTKGAALTLLGKVYLTKKQYSDAIGTLSQVLQLGYSLVPNYADVFDPQKKNGPESIFEIQYQGGNDLGEWSSFIYTFAPRLSADAVTGWPQSNPGGWNIPTNDIINSYEDGDVRKAASVGLDFKSPVTGDVVPYIKKYDHPHTIYGRTDDNWPVLRYADVLLMLAEAINEQSGPTSEAYNYLNAVRSRAGLKPVSALGQQEFRDKVLHERRVELAFENWRWFDLKRTMTAQQLTDFLNAYGAKEKANPTVQRQGIPYANTDYVFDAFEALYPLPNDELLINNKLTQNPGY
ncbi:RagB/SusD family nutrient uptake outer membrane protein [Ilyomonas limi]|uniref:RagB/SusD family nutrient uptake outer membrane protein n=1 Tax=Ilyomonas limi TaxID=2575867 RepID=A0A4U3L711_9BACT|nr:RagB/SusD family nutrient uptake outer membrane protein [Ilyomonas limi]TKK71041.1 RagB/SusD family nutrient uptake outer membrane protein [Ilyomonas limi]